MPVAFEVTKASNSEQTECKNLINTMEEKHPEYLDSCQYFMGDKGYYSNPILTMLKEKDIVPIIDICNKWKDGEETHQYKNTPLVYNYKGDVFYVPDKGEQIKLAYKGYDKSSMRISEKSIRRPSGNYWLENILKKLMSRELRESGTIISGSGWVAIG